MSSYEDSPEHAKEQKFEELLFEGHCSEPSPEHPERNEDVVLVDNAHGLFAVFDGMSEPRGGEIAAEAASLSVSDAFEEKELQDAPPEVAEAFMYRVLVSANRVVRGRQEIAGAKIGTTASVVKFYTTPEGSLSAVVGNVGDSRVYVWRGRQKFLEQVTLDDTVVRELGEQDEDSFELQHSLAEIEKEEDFSDPKVGDEAFREALKKIYDEGHLLTQALGGEKTVPRVHHLSFEDGDRVVIVSDAVHNNLTDHEIAGVVKEAKNPHEAARELVRRARARSTTDHLRAKVDDTSAVVVEAYRTKV